jgi:hypothetical protein
LFVPILELDLYRFSKRGNSFWLSFSGNKVEGCRISLSRRLAGTQHLPASFLPIFLNLQLNIESEGGQAFFGKVLTSKKVGAIFNI